MVSVLIVEDDAKSRETLRLYVEHAGWHAHLAGDGESGLRLAREEDVDVVLLDVMLPRMDGRAVCRALRRESNVPILMITARAAEDDRLTGLEDGADDYVIKPFSPREVIARIRAILRRCGLASTAVRELRGGELRVEGSARRVLVRGEEVRLTPTEFRILEVLCESPGRVRSRADLIERAFAGDSEATERTVDAHIRNLRRKIDAPGLEPFITTVFGSGYRLDP